MKNKKYTYSHMALIAHGGETQGRVRAVYVDRRGAQYYCISGDYYPL
jgi:hypothetical protein